VVKYPKTGYSQDNKRLRKDQNHEIRICSISNLGIWGIALLITISSQQIAQIVMAGLCIILPVILIVLLKAIFGEDKNNPSSESDAFKVDSNGVPVNKTTQYYLYKKLSERNHYKK